MKKHLWIFIALLGWAGMAFAQGGTVGYHAVVRDSENKLVVNTAMSVSVSIYDEAHPSAPVYSETHASVTSNRNGAITLELGTGTGVSGNWADIDWGSAIVTAVMSAGGTTIATHTTPATAVPYALRADELSGDAKVLENYVTLGRLADTLGHYSDRAAAKTIIHDTAEVLRAEASVAAAQLSAQRQQNRDALTAKAASDSAALDARIRNAAAALAAQWNADSLTVAQFVAANRDTILKQIKADSVGFADAMNQFTSLLLENLRDDSVRMAQRLHNDSLALRTKIDQNRADIAALVEATYDAIGDKAERDSVDIEAAASAAASAIAVHQQADSAAVESALAGAYAPLTALTGRVNTFNAHVCDSISTCVDGWIADTVAALRGNLHAGISTLKSGLATVAFTGSYNDLTNKPDKLGSFTPGTTNFLVNKSCDSLTFCQLVEKVNGLQALKASLEAVAARRADSIAALQSKIDSLSKAFLPSLALTTDLPSGAEEICILKDSTRTVTYTATIANDDDHLSGYTFAWTVDGEAKSGTGSTLEMTYTSAATTHTVVCTATRGAVVIADEVQTVVTESDVVPTLSYTSKNDASTYNLDQSTLTGVNNVSAATWYNAKGEVVGNYKTPNTDISFLKGVYTVELTNSEGCVARKKVELLHTSCAISGSLYASESGTATAVDSVQDHEGNWYDVVQIGNQCWLKENMRCKSSPKGTQWTPITSTSSISVSSLNPKCYWYDLNNVPLRQRGYLYNWIAAIDTVWADQSAARNAIDNQMSIFENRRGICPEGWHVPTKTEWIQLAADVFDGITDVAAQVSNTGDRWLQKTGTSTVAPGASRIAAGKWYSISTKPGTPGYLSASDRNSSHFSVIPSAFVNASSSGSNTNGSYSYKDEKGASFYSATPSQSTDNKGYRAYRIWFECGTGDSHVGMYVGGYKSYFTGTARSVRCVRNS